MKAYHSPLSFFALLAMILVACTAQSQPPTQPAHKSARPNSTVAAEPAAATGTPPVIPSATAPPMKAQTYIAATVWSSDPIVPVLAYHQFQEHGISGATHVRLDDFRTEMESLSQAGYTLIPLDRWLAGDLRVPAGKRPLIFTMDDLFYRNQIRFLPDGMIDPGSGLGASYQFSQVHPDFGYAWALFSNLGDKPYIDANNPLILAKAIVWCIEHGAMVYNHTYTHALLSQTSPTGITWELSANDVALNHLLELAQRPDLIPKLGNIFALPFGRWPRDSAGENSLIHYKSPSGVPIQAIMNIDYVYRPKYMVAPYLPEFRRWDLPRIVATVAAVDYFSKNIANVPAAESCELGPLDLDRSGETKYVADQINEAIQLRRCVSGIYATDKYVFRAQGSAAQLISTVGEHP